MQQEQHHKTIINENSARLISKLSCGISLHKVTTSGSTGAPLSIWQDRGKRLRHTAENIYFSELAGSQLGSRLYYLRVWNAMNRKTRVKSCMQNVVMVDADNLCVEGLESFLETLSKDTSTKSLLAFSSTLEALSLVVKDWKQKCPVGLKSVISISETLPEGARIILEKGFNCPVISRYSNMENGFLAQQCGDKSGEYHINTASFIIELLHPENNELVKPGELGRIVVTDLFNYAMPIIRYDTGDMAVFSNSSNCGKRGPVFTTVAGRRVDYIYDTQGHMLSPHVITNTMWKYSEVIKQFQFIQNGQNDYLMKLNCSRATFDKETELLTDIRNYTGLDAKILIEYIDEIPLLASGKRRKVVNNFIKLLRNNFKLSLKNFQPFF